MCVKGQEFQRHFRNYLFAVSRWSMGNFVLSGPEKWQESPAAPWLGSHDRPQKVGLMAPGTSGLRHLRAFSTEDGRILWDVDTVKRYDTVNGVQAAGGSLDGAGPVIAGGRVYVNSGYPRFGGVPGNVLLVFGVP